MKISIQYLAHANAAYNLGFDPLAIAPDDLIGKIGLQLGAVEEVVHLGKRYDGAVVAKIVSCEKHPNADKLNVCRIDDGGATNDVERGEDGLVQVVCGAPNARSGITVVWLPPGCTVPASYEKDPFVLGARELRGVVSNGMLASPKELALNEEHDGILELTEEDNDARLLVPGTPFKQLFGLDDVIIDLENKMFTHRPDCFGSLGVARELAGISGASFRSPDWYLADVAISPEGFGVRGSDTIPDLVPRFMLQNITDVQVAKSPLWLQAYLSRHGMRPINNVVDMTNYYMHLTAQPTHAFDADKLLAITGAEDMSALTLGPRRAHDGEQLALLNGKTITLSSQDIVICANDIPVALGGVMGGSESEVDESTKNIVIECATFDMFTIRRTSMRHGLFTDAVTRYNKGQNHYQNPRVLAKLTDDISKLTHGSKAAGYDSGAAAFAPKQINVSAQVINERLGSNLSVAEMNELLSRVEITAVIDGDELRITVPFWRQDLEIAEDIIEEIGRLYGFSRLPQLLPARSAKAAPKNALLSLKSDLRGKLVAGGANEVLTYNFVHGNLIDSTGQDKQLAYHLRNAISPDLQYYRLSVVPSLLDKITVNIRSDMPRDDDNEIALFEIGTAHNKQDMNPEGLPDEEQVLGFIFSADQKTAARKYVGSAYYQAKAYLETILPAGSRIVSVASPESAYLQQASRVYDEGRRGYIMFGETCIGVIGEIRSSIKKKLKLPEYTAGFELSIRALHTAASPFVYKTLSNFPKTSQDMTYEVSQQITFRDMINAITNSLDAQSAARGYRYELKLKDIFTPEGSSVQRFTFRAWLYHDDRTLTTTETNAVLDTISQDVAQSVQGTRI